MPNDGNKIYSQTIGGTRYGVSLDRDINPVLGLPVTTSINTAATSSRVNADSLFKPIPVSTPPDLTTAGKTDVNIRKEMEAYFGALNYGYDIQKISVKATLTEAEMTANKKAVWERLTFGNNHYRCVDHFDGYNHTVKYTGQWGVTQVSAVDGTVGFNVQLASGGASMDMVAPVNMKGCNTVGPNSYYGVAVYWKYATQGTYAYRCVAILTAGDPESGSVASSVRLSGNPLKQDETYVFVPFYSPTKVTKTIATTQNGGINFDDCGLSNVNDNVYTAKFKAGYDAIVEAVAVNNVPTYDLTIAADASYVTGSAKYSNGSSPAIWKIDIRVYKVVTPAPPTTLPTVQGKLPDGEQWTELWNGSVDNDKPTAYSKDNGALAHPLPPLQRVHSSQWQTSQGEYVVVRATATTPSSKSWTAWVTRKVPASEQAPT